MGTAILSLVLWWTMGFPWKERFEVMALAAGAPAGMRQLAYAVATLETGHGTSRISKAYHNLFGIKGAGTSGSADGTAIEWDAEKGYYQTPDRWAMFRNDIDCIAYWARWILSSPRYSADVKAAGTLREAITALHVNKYATEPAWADRVAGVARDAGWDPDAPWSVDQGVQL